MIDPIEITLPFATPTVNHLYGQRPGGFGRARYIKPEAKEIRKEIEEIIHNLPIKEENFLNKKLKVTVEIHEDWFCKNGTVKRKDVANREKFLIDSVFGALGMDDKFIFEHSISKVQDDAFSFCTIKIEVMGDGTR